jgi:hypothetical protein
MLSAESHEYLVRDALREWCPSWPRRVTQRQLWARDPDEALRYLEQDSGNGFVTVASYPDGPPGEGHVPRIESVFFDFDVPSDGLYGRPESSAEASEVSWRLDMAQLLGVLSDVVGVMTDAGIIESWRFALSGHKGVHMFLDLPALPLDIGEQHQYSVGIDRYVTQFVGLIESEIGYSLDRWLDVDSSDLARLTRLPNTQHPTASRLFGEARYCVPVSAEELDHMTPGEYIELTRSPRLIPVASRRHDSENAYRKLVELIAEASPRRRSAGASVSPTTVTAYDRAADDAITLYGTSESVQSILMDTPAMWEWRSRDDAFAHGAESHYFEFAVILKLVANHVPRDMILQFFSEMNGYDEQFTRDRIATVISMGYEFPVGVKKLMRNCPTFFAA